ncbi:dihydrodipicolinate reductase [Rhodobacterales bacterium HKCCSP123]|nr:dihydrodipicolinate reductase [Rhodobacterales bacterium HKCCSP123]
MTRRTTTLSGLVTLATLGLAAPEMARAEEFRPVESIDRFLSLTNGRELRRLGIRVQVMPEGRIEGRAFGGPVAGEWTWEGGYFCRDLFWNGDDLGYNCQLVEENGDTLRFTTDRGAGIYADLTLR